MKSNSSLLLQQWSLLVVFFTHISFFFYGKVFNGYSVLPTFPFPVLTDTLSKLAVPVRKQAFSMSLVSKAPGSLTQKMIAGAVLCQHASGLCSRKKAPDPIGLLRSSPFCSSGAGSCAAGNSGRLGHCRGSPIHHEEHQWREGPVSHASCQQLACCPLDAAAASRPLRPPSSIPPSVVMEAYSLLLNTSASIFLISIPSHLDIIYYVPLCKMRI